MDTESVKAAARNNNRVLLGGAAVAVLGYYWYRKRTSEVHNIGDAVSRSCTKAKTWDRDGRMHARF